MTSLLAKLGFAEGVRAWVYPQSIGGRFQRLHRISGVDPAGHPAGRALDPRRGAPAAAGEHPGAEALRFGAIYTASDTVLILILLLSLAFALFFFTSLFGRLWCGYACPQTVFLEELIRPIEQFFEGDRNARVKRDAGPLTTNRVLRRLGKWVVFALVAISGCRVVRGVLQRRQRSSGPAGAVRTSYAFADIMATIAFLDFAWFREQFCIYLCPYARFQGVMTDDHTLQITYETRRGEPRGGDRREGRRPVRRLQPVRQRLSQPASTSANGYQLECIGCARCIDACDHVMETLGHPGLIVYTTEAETRGEVRSLLRPRPIIYGGLITSLAVSAVAVVLRAHVTFEAELSRSPGSTFVLDDDDTIRNTYLLNIGNNDARPGADQLHRDARGPARRAVMAPPIALSTSEDRTVPVVVRLPRDSGAARSIPVPVPHQRAATTRGCGCHLHDARARRRGGTDEHDGHD